MRRAEVQGGRAQSQVRLYGRRPPAAPASAERFDRRRPSTHQQSATANAAACLALGGVIFVLLTLGGLVQLDPGALVARVLIGMRGGDPPRDGEGQGGNNPSEGDDSSLTAAQRFVTAASRARAHANMGGEAARTHENAIAGVGSFTQVSPFPRLARNASFGDYAQLPAFTRKSALEELESLTSTIQSADATLPSNGTGGEGEDPSASDPVAPHVHAPNHFYHAMSTLALPYDCRIAAGDAVTRAEDVEGTRTHPRLRSCAVVFPSGHLTGGGAGAQIEAHDHVFRLNGHNPPGSFSRLARDMGHRTDFRALSSAAINAGLKHDIHWNPSERWLLYSGCQHRNPQPWCAKLFVVLRQKPIAGLHFLPGEAHRAGGCLSALKREYLGPHRRYTNTPTTGFTTLLYASRSCGSVTVFGLCNTTSCNQALKWAGHSDKTGWKDPVHDFHLEHLAALLMARDSPERVRLWASPKGGGRGRQSWGVAAAAGRLAGRIRGGDAGGWGSGGRGGGGGSEGGGGGGARGGGDGGAKAAHPRRSSSGGSGTRLYWMGGGAAGRGASRPEDVADKEVDEIDAKAAAEVLGDRYRRYRDKLLGGVSDDEDVPSTP